MDAGAPLVLSKEGDVTMVGDPERAEDEDNFGYLAEDLRAFECTSNPVAVARVEENVAEHCELRLLSASVLFPR